MLKRLYATVTALVALMGCGGKDTPPKEAARGEASDSTLVVLDSAQRSVSGLVVGLVSGLPADTIKLTGTLSFDPARISHVGPRIQGRIRKVRVSIGAAVTAGDTLALLDSPELGTAQATWTKAAVARDVAARNLQRAERLSKDGIVSERRRLELEAELRERDAELAAAVQALAAFGAQPDSTAPGVFPLRTPLRGEVVEQHAVVGEVVGPESELFTVGDLSRLWVLLDLYETDVGRVRRGAVVRIAVDALPGADIEGHVEYIGAVVDSLSRTIKVRVEIDNRARVLKPGMFARVSLEVPGAPGLIGIPLTAVQTIAGKTVVFVPEGEGRFRIRPVSHGAPRSGGWVQVLSGLAKGDSVVLNGSFLLKAQLQREQFGGDE